jgi:hypothetical protein
MTRRLIVRERERMIRDTEEYLNRRLRGASVSDWPTLYRPRIARLVTRRPAGPGFSSTSPARLRSNGPFPGQRLVRWVVQAVRLVSRRSNQEN